MTPEFIIIGAGVVGLSSAFELAKRGAKVAILERGKTGMEASWAGGGILFPLLPWDYPEEVTSLALAGAALYPEWMKALHESSGIDPEYAKCGMTVLPGIRSMENAASWCASHGVRHFLDETGKFVLPDVAQVRNPRLISSLRTELERLGVAIFEDCEVLSFEKDGRRIVGLKTETDFYSAGHYVVCAGAWSKKLLGGDGPDI
ncbi:MAG TPA: FAD-dependent oxidoreductase, partial [Burkholderiales bacterium]|nr:FAD-dependent oxidoreductase [Burkholderiales bacterium]